MYRQHLVSLLIFFSVMVFLSLSEAAPFNGSAICGLSRAANVSVFIKNFVADMEALADLVGSNGWGDHAVGQTSPSPVYGLVQCFDYLSHMDCLLCFAECRTRLPKCLPATSARLFLDGCFLRYDNYSFYGEFEDRVSDKRICGEIEMEGGEKLGELSSNLVKVTELATTTAVQTGGFAMVENKGGLGNSLYAMAQCWKSLDIKGCRQCLTNAGRDIKRCFPRTEGRVLNAGCFMRYSTGKLPEAIQDNQDDEHGTPKVGIIVAVVTLVTIVTLLSICGACVGYRRVAKKRKEFKRLGKLTSVVNYSSLNCKYETLERATNYFDVSRKLGQGGSGSVYKGTLSDGTVVAVKRLFFNTTQWVEEFFNEVNLLSGVEHRNLVKLLGCSIEGPESLLIYEYVPNKSLDHMLFDKEKPQLLSWQERLLIIVGVAEGLAFLHSGANQRIIHRDIKSSNILLDENLNPKIADFGLVRGFSADKTHLSTGIAGTLGYMAPEYLVRGQLTDKADVYSFGVLILEIICGRKNTVYAKETGSVLSTVWKNYRSNTLTESVDPRLKGNFPKQRAQDVLQIGLLCTQALASLRPSMYEVVNMLTSEDNTIPAPEQPPFLNASVLEPDTPTLTSDFPSSSSQATSRESAVDAREPR
ncbi:cysteine-rich receptor-like protein kinase 42 isoform X2 [Aristolochia californica]|uniref:cysteine-rich receptor-like protein kinase 42 isoform X2 n=1 Tax=Aristolochia californica TaxID=171875 RepID=UPI0035E29E49